jgi:hypothetical protein
VLTLDVWRALVASGLEAISVALDQLGAVV